MCKVCGVLDACGTAAMMHTELGDTVSSLIFIFLPSNNPFWFLLK